MVHKISYEKAVKKIANLEKYGNLEKMPNIFDRSLILSIMFDEPKEKTLDDLTLIRAKDIVKIDPTKMGAFKIIASHKRLK
jgi:hypothetical protein